MEPFQAVPMMVWPSKSRKMTLLAPACCAVRMHPWPRGLLRANQWLLCPLRQWFPLCRWLHVKDAAIDIDINGFIVFNRDGETVEPFQSIFALHREGLNFSLQPSRREILQNPEVWLGLRLQREKQIQGIK